MLATILIGRSLEECKGILGEPIQTYRYMRKIDELVFEVGAEKITLFPIDGRIGQIGYYLNAPPADILAFLRERTGQEDWVEDESRNERITDCFPGWMPDAPNHTYFESSSAGLYAFYKKHFTTDSLFKVDICTADFRRQMESLPADPLPPPPPPRQPFFYHRETRFAARLGESGEFEHFFGHSGPLTIQRSPRLGLIHQVLNLDLRDPALGLSMPGLTRLPLLYCFQFELGQMEYEILSDQEIRIVALDDESFDEDWPYPGYPATFPCQSLSIGPSRPCTKEAFGEDVWQDVKTAAPEDFICIVRDSPLNRVYLWEEDEYSTYVDVKFYVSPGLRRVRVCNACD